MAGTPFETMHEQDEPSVVRQVSVFLENRVGQLLRLIQVFEGSSIRILAIQVEHAVDCAIVRLMLDETDNGLMLLRRAGFPTAVTELVVVELPPGAGLLTICSALLSAELSVDYAYPLLAQPTGRPALALHCDNQAMAAQVLRDRRFTILDENDFKPMR